ncbi:MAG: phospholipid carrier-dependent glycosyltransferase [Holophagales bacterium]|nr:phospholipid carrier-dependent glycosyltransferase [Holophagales bacterium]
MAIVKHPPPPPPPAPPANATPESRPARSTSPASPARPLGLLALAATVFFCTGLGALDLWAPDEPRYAAIAEELRSARHGPRGLVLLHLNDAPYDQKPPLWFWLAAAFGQVGGRVDEVAARLPSALAGVASVVLTFGIARMLRLPAVSAWLAAGLLATGFRFAFTARRAQLDVLLCAFELAAIGVFLLLETRRGGVASARRHPGWIAAFHGALGAAALVKGPVGWLPLGVIAVWLGWEGRLAAFRKLTPAWAWLLSLGPVALWVTLASLLAPDGFVRDAVGTNVFARFFAGTSHARPFYYYLYQLPLDGLPWSPLWLAGIPALVRAARRPQPSAPGPDPRATARLLVAWIGFALAFFSLSAGKRGLYLLPIQPALALAAALAVGTSRIRTRRLAWAIGAVALLELGGALLVLPRLDAEKSPRPIAESIARHSEPGERVGLYGLRPLEGAIPYYGQRPVEGLEALADARAFVARGGRLILMRERSFESLRAHLALAPVDRFRSGKRTLILARVDESVSASPPPAAAP